LHEVLERQKEQFVQCFEREPGEGDPVFLQKYIYSDDEYNETIVGAMEKAGCDPAYIYAHLKTGLLISQSTLKNATGADVEEWKDAVDEYNFLKEKGEIKTNFSHDFIETINDLKSEIINCIYVFGFVLDKHINVNRQDDSVWGKQTLDQEYINFCITKTIKTLRGIRILLDNFMSDEALILCRSIYENFLHIAFIKKNPEKIDDLVKAKIGLRTGTHEYKKTNTGRLDKRIIVEKETSKEYESHISAYRMAESSRCHLDVELFNDLYRGLSEFTHPSIFSIDSYVSEKGFDHLKSTTYERSFFYSIFLSALILSEVKTLDNIQNQLINDIQTFLNRIRSKLLQVLICLESISSSANYDISTLARLKERCENL
jgi:hypothetical protein